VASLARLVSLALLASVAVACSPSAATTRTAADSSRAGGSHRLSPSGAAPSDSDMLEADEELTPDSEAVMVPAWAPDFQDDTAGLDVASPWWALRFKGRAFALGRLPVSVVRTRDVCEEDPSASAPGIPKIATRADSVVLLLWGVSGLTEGPVTAGHVLGHDDGYVFSDPEAHPALVLDSARATFGADTLRFRGTRHGETGFRIELTAAGASQVLYSTDWQDEGSWAVRWVGDLNRDGLPDVLLDATEKYSVDVTLLYLSERREGQPAWAQIAAYEHVGC
jgi:hypothetical protein